MFCKYYMYYYKILKIGDDFFYILYFVKLNIIDEKYASNLRSIFFLLNIRKKNREKYYIF